MPQGHRQDPDFGNPYNDIGAYLIEKGEFDEAIPWFQKAMQAKRYESPAFPHLNLGRVYERKGKWTEAIDSYKKALALNPDYALARKPWGGSSAAELNYDSIQRHDEISTSR